MKIVTVVGARPQFIKAAMVSRVIRKRHHEVLVHTGQHYDYNMSEKFFEELSIPKPDYNLGISGGTHAQMTGKMLEAIEGVLIKEKPDWLLVYGDTNSTLAAALAAAKLHIAICHVEAGARTHSRTNPEEINRICTDHVSTLLLATTQSGMESMKAEGLTEKSCLVGDPMYDAFLAYKEKMNPDEIRLKGLTGEEIKVPEEFYYLTCHREENTKGDEALSEIFGAMEQLDEKTVYPVHPRNKERAARLVKENNFQNIILTEPVGYLESICLVNHAKKIVTDSGGLQREAFFAEKKCVTILDFVCWAETMTENRNNLAKPNKEDILTKLNLIQHIDKAYMPFGDGNAAEKIVEAMESVPA
ncbi:MAG: UDP-N-acetylglucosamine 2-epimerase (non-hydrolyzing) [Bacteroidales bacterium]|nr:UDP-N-acetylglucosamine 2-epimerase (non-hydrolyzing) [Clostridium sp.]MCM1202927.1 UDP-N-acetylglucosamine 2-epimerase (non-hydrolyzing) [Bacteroidales bacterium]